MKSSISLIIVALLALAAPTLAQKQKRRTPPPPPTITITGPKAIKVCAGSSVTLRTEYKNIDDPEAIQWTISGGQVVQTGVETTYSTGDLKPGFYTITAEYRKDECVAYSARLIQVEDCTPPACPPNFEARITAERPEIDAGETTHLTLDFPAVDAKRVAVEWTADAGTLEKLSDKTVKIDTTGARPGVTITVRAKVNTEGPNCEATATVTVRIKNAPKPPEPRHAGTCLFSRTSSRVDNPCKLTLTDVARILQDDPTASVLLIGEGPTRELAAARARNVADALINRSTGIPIDANRVTVKPQISGDDQVTAMFYPTGAKP